MAYQPHTLLTFGGTFGSGADSETWQSGIRLSETGQSGTSKLHDLTGYLSAITSGLPNAFYNTSAFSATSAGIPPVWARLTWAKAANIGADGKYSGSTDAHGGPNPASISFTGQTGYSTASAQPWFLTLALSFHTASPTKYARHGRIYVPLALPSAGSGSPRIDSTTRANAVTWVKTLLTNISKPVSTGSNVGAIRPVVASKHAGELFEISEVRVGDVIDVQRRRKKSLREAYAVSAWS